MKLLKDAEFVCLDCEMTGLDPRKDRVIEVALVRFTFDRIVETFESLVNPECEVSPASQKIHHISNEMLRNQPTMDAVLPKIVQFIRPKDIIVGHSVDCDINILTEEASRLGTQFPKNFEIFDTVRLAKEYGDSPNNSLEALARHFAISSIGNHRAMKDVMINIEIFKYLCRRFRTVTQIRELLSKPIKMKYMPLGKHKGRPFSEIPLSYLIWASKMDFDADLLFTIRQEIKQRKKKTGFLQASNPFANI